MADYNKTNLRNLFNSVKSGNIKIGTAIKMITGGTIGSGLLPTTGKKMGSTLQVPGTKKAKGGMVKGYATGGSVSRGQYASQPKKVKFKGVF